MDNCYMKNRKQLSNTIRTPLLICVNRFPLDKYVHTPHFGNWNPLITSPQPDLWHIPRAPEQCSSKITNSINLFCSSKNSAQQIACNQPNDIPWARQMERNIHNTIGLFKKQSLLSVPGPIFKTCEKIIFSYFTCIIYSPFFSLKLKADYTV